MQARHLGSQYVFHIHSTDYCKAVDRCELGVGEMLVDLTPINEYHLRLAIDVAVYDDFFYVRGIDRG